LPATPASPLFQGISRPGKRLQRLYAPHFCIYYSRLQMLMQAFFCRGMRDVLGRQNWNGLEE